MKSIGIITIWGANNYGAELQACALVKALNLQRYKAELINYPFYKNKRHIREKKSKHSLPYDFKDEMKEILLPLIERCKCLRYNSLYNERKCKFEKFHKDHSALSTIEYQRLSTLNANPPKYDYYCVGSDQVWNPRCYTSLDPYFLGFAPSEAKLFSYASSFGVGELDDKIKPQYTEWLSRLTNISVREEAGKVLVNKLVNKDVVITVDPTLLLGREDWMKMAAFDLVPSDKYLLIYALHTNDYLYELAYQVAEKFDLKIIQICKGAYKQNKDKRIHNILNAGPEDFVGLFSRADFVITNSFHGNVFAIIMQKSFYTVLKRGKANNTRQLNICGTLDLLDRIVYSDEPLNKENLGKVNYVGVELKLKLLVKSSFQFLKKVLDEK